MKVKSHRPVLSSAPKDTLKHSLIKGLVQEAKLSQKMKVLQVIKQRWPDIY